MLTEVADGVFVRQSAFCLSNAIVVRGDDGVLLIDPGVSSDDLAELSDDLDQLGVGVSLGFATHPHWDHVLWHRRLGAPARVGTATCAAEVRARRPKLQARAQQLAPGVDPALVGRILPLEANGGNLTWSGPKVQVFEHRAHARGHAALLVPHAGALVAGDMLSDVEIPLLDPEGDDPVGEYVAALDQLGELCGRGLTALVPGHGAVARGAEIQGRVEADRAYLLALRQGADPADPRLGSDARYGTDWLPMADQDNRRLAAR